MEIDALAVRFVAIHCTLRKFIVGWVERTEPKRWLLEELMFELYSHFRRDIE